MSQRLKNVLRVALTDFFYCAACHIRRGRSHSVTYRRFMGYIWKFPHNTDNNASKGSICQKIWIFVFFYLLCQLLTRCPLNNTHMPIYILKRLWNSSLRIQVWENRKRELCIEKTVTLQDNHLIWLTLSLMLASAAF